MKTSGARGGIFTPPTTTTNSDGLGVIIMDISYTLEVSILSFFFYKDFVLLTLIEVLQEKGRD